MSLINLKRGVSYLWEVEVQKNSLHEVLGRSCFATVSVHGLVFQDGFEVKSEENPPRDEKPLAWMALAVMHSF